jgi:hypothetical protein
MGLLSALALILACWIAGAIFYDVGKATRWGAALAVAWLTMAVAAVAFWRPLWQPLALLAAASGAFLRWWFTLRPSSARAWDQDFAQVPRATIAGDVVTIGGVRNTDYSAGRDEGGKRTTRFETRAYRLSELRGVDVLVLFWGSPWMCHPMFVFDFGPDGRVCVSIEVRYRVGQKFSILRSLYRQQELAYVVCDERDAILRRTKYLPGHELYLYRFDVGALAMRQFFLEYVMSINALADAPRWYHGITTNCTTSIYLQGRSHMTWNWRMYANGTLDRLLYARRFLDQSLPFEELKRQSRVNDVANTAPAEGFGDDIRARLAGYREGVGPAGHAHDLLEVGEL